MKYAKIANGIVEQIQPNKQDGFIEISDDVICGMIDDGDGTFSNPIKTQAELDAEAQVTINTNSLAYLASTDWYIIRSQETSVIVPQDILDARASARLAIIPVV